MTHHEADEIIEGFRVKVEFKSSTTKDGREGYSVVITDGATRDAVDHCLDLAMDARRRCLAEISRYKEEAEPK